MSANPQGLGDGTIVAYTQEGKRISSWLAHASPVAALAVAGTRVYSMGADGTVTGWSAILPSAGWMSLRSPHYPTYLRLPQRKDLLFINTSPNPGFLPS